MQEQIERRMHAMLREGLENRTNGFRLLGGYSQRMTVARKPPKNSISSQKKLFWGNFLSIFSH